MKIKNIILDMGNVLLDYDTKRILDTFCDITDARDVINTELFNGPEWIMADKGDIHETDKFSLVKTRVPDEYHDALKRCVDGWPDTMIPVDGAKDFVALIKNKGYGVYVLSNAADNFHKYFGNNYPEELFDGIVVSAEVKLLKPDRVIYEYLLNKYGLKADECLFIDDRKENVEAARALGMSAHLFENNYDVVIRDYIR